MRPFLPHPGSWPLILALVVGASTLASDVIHPDAVPPSDPLPRFLLPGEPVPPVRGAVGPMRAAASERILRVNPVLLSPGGGGLQVGDRVRLDLLENQDVTVQLTRIGTASDGALELQGTLADLPGGTVQLVLAGNGFSGLAQVPGLGVFQWLPEPDGSTRVTRLPDQQAGRCVTMGQGVDAGPGGEMDRRPAGPLAVADGRWDPATEPVVLDVMILYTPRALASHGDEESLRRGILRMVDDANRSYTNSLIGVRLNPVWVGLHPTWVENGNMLTDFNNMFGDSRITAWRNDFKADIVYLVIESDANGYGGAATLLSNPLGDANRGMSIMRRGVFIGNPLWAEHASLTFTHETAHVLGAGHDREHGYPSAWQGLPSAFPYANGFRFDAGGVTYRTAMAYDPGIQLSLFSNPDQTFDGVQLGVPIGQPGEADNAQTLNRIAPVVANYRIARSRIGFAEPAVRVGEGGGSVTLRLERVGDLNTATRVNLALDPNSSAKAILDYTRPTSALVSFATNQAMAEVIIPILQDDLVEGDEVLRITLVNVLGHHGLSSNSECVITIRDDEPGFVVSRDSLVLPETGGSAEVWVEFTGALDAGAVRDLDLVIGQEGDTATLGSDFAVTPTRLAFTDGNRRQSFRVEAMSDDLDEADETARIGVGNGSVTLRLLDDDRPGAVRPSAAPNGTVIALKAVDGGALIAGDFTEVGGVPRTGVARLRGDGSPDLDFNPPELVNSRVKSFVVPPAKILSVTQLSNGDWMLGGFVGLADGLPARNLVRLKPDGRMDMAFAHPGFDSAVHAVVEQPDGRLLVGGTFDHVGQERLRGLVRLMPDGSVDRSFRLEPGMQGVVVAGIAIGLLPDGRILVGGLITGYNGQTVRNLIRLNPDGSLDQTFPLLAGGASTHPVSIAVLPDGRAYVGGFFETIGGRAFRRLVRLNRDGSVDPGFRAPQPNGEVMDLQPLPNGQLLVGGAFTNVAGGSRRFVALLNQDGTLDQNFDLGRGAGDHVWCLSAGGDGSLHLGGTFQRFNDQAAPYLARLRLPSIAAAFIGTQPGTGDPLQSRVWGLPGARHGIESSPDLGLWESVGEVVVPDAGITGGINLPQRGDHGFYRLVNPIP